MKAYGLFEGWVSLMHTRREQIYIQAGSMAWMSEGIETQRLECGFCKMAGGHLDRGKPLTAVIHAFSHWSVCVFCT